MNRVIEKIEINIMVNGHEYHEIVEPRMHLSDFLRNQLELTGTHIGCEVGVCGACTVLVNDETVRSCLTFAAQLDGATITTIEGLSIGEELSPLQKAFTECHGLQCGFCTPGILAVATELLQKTPDASRDHIREVISGNLCRCTGYETIIDAVESALSAIKQESLEGAS